MTDPQQERRIPVNFEAWLKDDTAVPIAPAPGPESLLEAVNRWIREKPGVELSADFLAAHDAKIVCEMPRSLSEHRDEDK